MNNHKMGKHILFYTYLNDVKGFSPYIHEFKQHVFRFKTNHLSNAKKRLNELSAPLLKTNHTSTHLQHKTTMVSIHVRMGDYSSHLKKVFGLPLVPDDYFSRAMQHIAEQQSNSVRISMLSLSSCILKLYNAAFS